MFIYKAGVVGAGRMGAEIAQVISFSGLPVVLIDQNEEVVAKGLQTVQKIYKSRVEKGKMTQMEAEQKMTLVSTATDYSALSDADIVIEAIYEEINAKKELFSKLDKVLPESSILASNTSALSLSEMSAATNRPERVIGMHFFNPAHVMKLVEVIPSLTTSPEVVDDVVAFAESLRKIPVKVNECAGFLVNRLLMPYLNEAAIALQDGSASIKEIDNALVEFGMPMGPFTLMDMIGIDIGEKVAKILADSLGSRMDPAEVFSDLIKVGRLGQKTGEGFYSYTDGSDFVPEIKEGKSTGFSVERVLLPMVNEAIICYQEGVSSPSDIDIAMVAGIGFPQDLGGPLHWADSVGLDEILSLLNENRASLGDRFLAAPMLKRMVSAGFTGKEKGRGFFSY